MVLVCFVLLVEVFFVLLTLTKGINMKERLLRIRGEIDAILKTMDSVNTPPSSKRYAYGKDLDFTLIGEIVRSLEETMNHAPSGVVYNAYKLNGGKNSSIAKNTFGRILNQSKEFKVSTQRNGGKVQRCVSAVDA